MLIQMYHIFIFIFELILISLLNLNIILHLLLQPHLHFINWLLSLIVLLLLVLDLLVKQLYLLFILILLGLKTGLQEFLLLKYCGHFVLQGANFCSCLSQWFRLGLLFFLRALSEGILFKSWILLCVLIAVSFKSKSVEWAIRALTSPNVLFSIVLSLIFI